MDFAAPAAPEGTTAPEGAADSLRAGPLSRRGFLRATATATVTASALTTAGAPAATAASGTRAATAASSATTLTFTAATGGSATLAPAGDRLVAEIQNVLWSLPRKGGTAVPLTAPGLEPTRPQFSPDGTLLVVCAFRDGGFHLWTLRPDGSGLRQLTDGPWDDRGPAWSPDGTRIAFASERGGDTVTGAPYRIWVVDVRTGELTRLTGHPGQRGPGRPGGRGSGEQESRPDARWEDFDPTWSPDGKRVLFVRATVTPTNTLRAATLASVAADGTGPITIEHTDDSGAQLVTPAVSPTGRLAHLRTTASPAASCTLVVDGKPVPVAGDVLPAPPRWTDGGRLLLTVDGRFRLLDPDTPGDGEDIPFTAPLPVDRPRYRVKAYDFDGTGVRPVRALHLPALSPDGRSVAFAALNALWTCGTRGGRPPRKVVQVPATRYVSAPVWTPDGTALVYTDDRAGLFAVRHRDLATGEETVLAGGGRVFPALSPDGTRLACLDMSGNLVVRDLPDGAERTLAAPLGAGGLPGRPSWSPDGRYVALCDRNRLNQRFREGYNLIRVVDTTTGTSVLHALAPHTSLSDRYDSGPVWSPDGRWMAVIAESALWLLPVTADGTPDGEPRRLTDEVADHPSWSADARTLLHLSAGTLRLLDIGSGSTRTVRVPLDHRRPRPADTVVHAGRLWDGTGPDVRENVDVVIRHGRIAEVSPHRAGRRPAAHHVDASERTVIPGLWDAHTHPWQTTYGGRQTALQLAYGITTAVSLGGFAYEQARIREAVAAGDMAGPRLLTTGELLDGARVAYSMGRAHRTREGLRRTLARAAALDWDFVKTYVRAPAWVMREAADFGHHRLGVRSGSHLCTPGVQSGQDLTTHLQATQRLEFGHATSATARAYQDVVEIYTATDFHLVATPFTAFALLGSDPALAEDPRVTVLMPPWDTALVHQQAGQPPTGAQLATLEREMSVYRRILAGGGLVALGTDQPIVPAGLHLHLALRALHGAGLSPAEALHTATLLPARVFGAEGDLGTLQEGRLADLTVVDGDPFTDFATLIRTVAVLRGGVLFKQADLVDAFDTPDTRRSSPQPSHPTGAEYWLQVGRRMRREGCCDPECEG
ncbi:amidohydrolase family protein [Streptomyces sp. M41]|uniref:amidohydrolase family protein n=1 Tax=Streptomyces sp. M41 TaxID=3059412 RepID=UPI00374C8C89